VVDAAAAERGRATDELEAEICARAERLGVPLLVALNKIDLLEQKETLLPLIERWQRAAAVVPICALDGDGVDRLIEEIWPRLAPGPAFFDGEALTDRSLRWLCAETIREQVFLRTRQEIPYSTAVVVERFTERPDRGDTVLEAVIYVERESQKGIVVGRGGQMIKRIGSDARRELEPLLGGTVHLRLRVAVESDWSRSARGMRRVGYEP
jgi:GTP-binding protein Era